MLHSSLPPSHSSSTMFKIAHRVIWWLQMGGNAPMGCSNHPRERDISRIGVPGCRIFRPGAY